MYFWTYFIAYAVHIVNKMPTPLLQGKSPSEKLYNTMPDYMSLKTFGCLVFVNTLSRNMTKFCNRAQKGFFLGLERGVKGYKVYIPDTKQIVTTSDVKFFENIFPYLEEKDSITEEVITHEEQREHNADQDKALNNNSEKSKRQHKQPSYLQDYHCLLSKGVSIKTLEEGKLYPLSNVLSYN